MYLGELWNGFQHRDTQNSWILSLTRSFPQSINGVHIAMGIFVLGYERVNRCEAVGVRGEWTGLSYRWKGWWGERPCGGVNDSAVNQRTPQRCHRSTTLRGDTCMDVPDTAIVVQKNGKNKGKWKVDKWKALRVLLYDAWVLESSLAVVYVFSRHDIAKIVIERKVEEKHMELPWLNG